MNDQSPVDWLSATQDERAQLYRVIRAIADMTGQSAEAVIELAIGAPLLTGTDYLSNVRKGKISRSKARLIHAWIQRTHPAAAQAIAPELFAEVPQTHQSAQLTPPVRSEIGRLLPDDIPDPILEPYAFSRYVDEHAIEGPLRIISLAPRKGLVTRADEMPRKPTQTLKLGEPFCFELDSPCDGEVIMLQGYQGRWHPVPLGDTGDHKVLPIVIGTFRLPSAAITQRPDGLVENESRGTHRFACLILENISRCFGRSCKFTAH